MISPRVRIERDAVALHYDELDHFYRDVWGEHVHHGLWRRGDETREKAVGQLAELVAEEAQIAHGVRVCDIGCGYGATSRLLAVRGAKVTGITISPAQFAVARERQAGNANPEFVLGDWLENDLPADSFDAAIAIESSEHMPDISKFFAQAQRVLRRGGRLVVCAWLSAEKPSRRATKWLLEPICREGRMPFLGSASDYESLGRLAGFELYSSEDLTASVSRTWPAIVRSLLAKLVTKPRYLNFLVSRHVQNSIFALTILRIWVAYKVGAIRYGVFTFVKE